MKVCSTPGCPTLIPKTNPSSKCHNHERATDKARGTSKQRGYGKAHTQLRAAHQARMNAGEALNCWRCGTRINPTNWHLGHDDHDRAKYRGPECVPCNTATAGRRGQAHHEDGTVSQM